MRASVVRSGCWRTVTRIASPTPSFSACAQALAGERQKEDAAEVAAAIRFIMSVRLSRIRPSIRSSLPRAAASLPAAAASRRRRAARNCSISGAACASLSGASSACSSWITEAPSGVANTAISPGLHGRAGAAGTTAAAAQPAAHRVHAANFALRTRSQAAELVQIARLAASARSTSTISRRRYRQLAQAVDAPLGEQRRVFRIEGAHLIARAAGAAEAVRSR